MLALKAFYVFKAKQVDVLHTMHNSDKQGFKTTVHVSGRSFICSSNNHISRIQGMVERLCAAHGTHLTPEPAPGCKAEQAEDDAAQPLTGPAVAAAQATPMAPVRQAAPGIMCSKQAVKQEADVDGDSNEGSKAVKAGQEQGRRAKGGAAAVVAGAPAAVTQPVSQQRGGDSLAYYTFPTLEQLTGATEEGLRAAGFGWVTVRLCAVGAVVLHFCLCCLSDTCL